MYILFAKKKKKKYRIEAIKDKEILDFFNDNILNLFALSN